MDRIYANPGELDGAAKQIKAATLRLRDLGSLLRSTDLPQMPADKRARIEALLSEALDDMRVLVADSAQLAVMLARTAMKFRKTDGDDDKQLALGAALNELDRQGLLVEYVRSGELIQGEAPDAPFSDWTGFVTDLATDVGAAWLVTPAKWEVVKVDQQGREVSRQRAKLATRARYYGRYAKTKFLTDVLLRTVPTSRVRLNKVPAVPRVPHGVGWSKVLGAGGLALGAYSEYKNAEQKYSYNLTLDDGGVRERAGVTAAKKTGVQAVGGAVAGTACAPLGPVAFGCAAGGAWLAGKLDDWL